MKITRSFDIRNIELLWDYYACGIEKICTRFYGNFEENASVFLIVVGGSQINMCIDNWQLTIDNWQYVYGQLSLSNVWLWSNISLLFTLVNYGWINFQHFPFDERWNLQKALWFIQCRKHEPYISIILYYSPTWLH